MYGAALTKVEADRALEKISAETPHVVEELAELIASKNPTLAREIRAADPESLVGVVEWALPFLRNESRVEAGDRISFTERGTGLLSRLGNLYAQVLLVNHPKLEWRVGDDPEDPAHYAYQNHVVVGVKGADEEVDPFIVVLNTARRLLKGGKPDSLLRALREWTKGIPK